MKRSQLKPGKGFTRPRTRIAQRSPRKTIRDKADDLWEQAILLRDDHKCQNKDCKEHAIDAHHIIHKWRMSVRYDLGNGISLCRRCHSMDGSAAQKSVLLKHIITWLGGEQAYEALREKGRQLIKTSFKLHCQAAIVELRAFIKSMKAIDTAMESYQEAMTHGTSIVKDGALVPQSEHARYLERRKE